MTSTQAPHPTETIPSPPTPLPAPSFTGNCVSPDAIFTFSPIGAQWLIGVSFELWGVEPGGNTELLARFTPFDQYHGPSVRLSPDETMLAFGVETGGALYYPGTGEFLRFRGVDIAQDERSSIGSFTWSTDSRSLYYSCCYQAGSSQIWRIHINDPEKPQLIAEELGIQAPTGNYELYPAAVLPDGRLLMKYFLTEGSNNAAWWDMTTNRAIALTYQGKPIRLWDTQDMQAVFDTGPQTPLLIGRLGHQAEMLNVVEAQPLDARRSFYEATFLPDGRIVALWEAEAAEPAKLPQYDVVLLTPGDTGYSMTMLTPDLPANVTEPYYYIAIYGTRLIIEAADTGTGQAVLLQVPLDGSPARPLAEGVFAVVIP